MLVVKEIKVYETKEYYKFKPLVGQPKGRAKANARKLIPSLIQEGGNLEPIQVNEDYEVIDGNTRLEGCRRQNLPVRYIIVKSTDVGSLKLMKMLNTTGQKWSTDNLIDFYAVGYKYQPYRDLKLFLADNDIKFGIFSAVSGIKKETIEAGELQEGIRWSKLSEAVDIILQVVEAVSNITDSVQNVARALMPYLNDKNINNDLIVTEIVNKQDKAIFNEPLLAESRDTKALFKICLSELM